MSYGTPVTTLQGANIPARVRTRDIREFTFLRGSGEVLPFLEAAGQSFNAGQWVVLNTSGLLVEAANAQDRVMGIALVDATGVANSRIPVQLATQDSIFRGVCLTPANLAQTLVGDYVDLNVTAGVHRVSESLSVQDVFQIVGFPDGATTYTSATFGQVDVRVVSTQVGQIAEEAL